MNYPDRVTLVYDVSTPPRQTADVPAAVSLISAHEAQGGAFAISDVSVRVPPGYEVLPSSGSVRVLTGGPLAGSYNVQQVRPNRQHTRYVVRRVS